MDEAIERVRTIAWRVENPRAIMTARDVELLSQGFLRLLNQYERLQIENDKLKHRNSELADRFRFYQASISETVDTLQAQVDAGRALAAELDP